MATTGRMTIGFREETRRLLEGLVPAGERTEFVDQAVRQALQIARGVRGFILSPVEELTKSRLSTSSAKKGLLFSILL